MTSSYRSGKVSHLTLLVLSCITIGIGLLVGKNIYALDLDLIFSSFQPTLAPKTFPVDFKRWGNQYIWWIIIEWTEALQQIQQIYFPWNDTTIRCGRKVKWYYFNSARWLRLWPLDDNSLNILKRDDSYSSLNLEWWLYTSCIGHPQDIVGYIKYTEEAWVVDQWDLFFWVSTDTSNNTATHNYTSSWFILKDGKYPQGNFYDSIVGIGEVSSLIDQVNEGIANTARNITVQWRLGISSVVDSLERNTIKTNIGKKSLIYSSDEVTSSKIINLALKNAAIACRGWNTFETLYEALDSSSKVICIDADGTDIIINENIANELANKDVVIKNSNVIINKSVYINNKSLSLFIDKWNLIIDTKSISSSDLKNFDNNGYVSSSTSTTVTQWILLQGNYIINGLIYGGTNNNTDGDIIPVKTFIHGKFASLNLPTTSYPQREKQVTNVLWSADYNDRISLANVFKWRCDPMTWKGVFNPNFSTASEIHCDKSNDNHRDSSLIVIEKNYPSTLLLNK